MSKYFKACYKCEDRHQGCHASCEKYKAERKYYDSVLEVKNREDEARRTAGAVQFKSKQKERGQV